jgi:hypothetical protein
MGIPSITETSAAPPAMPAAPPVAAPATPSVGAPPVTTEAKVEAVQPVAEPPKPAPPPPPPPKEAFPFQVAVAEDVATGRKVYNFLDEDTGRTVVQIPVEAVLNLVADIIAKLEAQGRA